MIEVVGQVPRDEGRDGDNAANAAGKLLAGRVQHARDPLWPVRQAVGRIRQGFDAKPCPINAIADHHLDVLLLLALLDRQQQQPVGPQPSAQL